MIARILELAKLSYGQALIPTTGTYPSKSWVGARSPLHQSKHSAGQALRAADGKGSAFAFELRPGTLPSLPETFVPNSFQEWYKTIAAG